MKLIEIIDKDGILWSLYKGIDFEKVYSHPLDGSGGMMICFIEAYNIEQKSFEETLSRNKKLSTLLNEKADDNIYEKHRRFTDVGSNYVIIYQCGANEPVIINAIKDKIINNPSSFRYQASSVRGAFI